MVLPYDPTAIGRKLIDRVGLACRPTNLNGLDGFVSESDKDFRGTGRKITSPARDLPKENTSIGGDDDGCSHGIAIRLGANESQPQPANGVSFDSKANG